MPHVMLRRDWQGNFKRTVKTLDGNESRRLEFSPGEVVEITPDEILSIQFDLGKALLPVEWSDEKRKFVVVDLEAVDLTSSVATEEAPESAPEPIEPTPPTPESAPEPIDAPHARRRHGR